MNSLKPSALTTGITHASHQLRGFLHRAACLFIKTAKQTLGVHHPGNTAFSHLEQLGGSRKYTRYEVERSSLRKPHRHQKLNDTEGLRTGKNCSPPSHYNMMIYTPRRVNEVLQKHSPTTFEERCMKKMKSNPVLVECHSRTSLASFSSLSSVPRPLLLFTTWSSSSPSSSPPSSS